MNGRRRFTIDRRRLRLGNGIVLGGVTVMVTAYLVEFIGQAPTLARVMYGIALTAMLVGVIIVRRAWKCPKCQHWIRLQAVPNGRERGGFFYCPHCGAQLEVK